MVFSYYIQNFRHTLWYNQNKHDQRYINQEIYNKEQHNVLKKYAQYVGHIQQLNSSKGSYFAGRILDEPFITIRQNDNTNDINSFFNVCRHHASQLTFDTKGTIDFVKGLQCPYHGWTYTVNGQLQKSWYLFIFISLHCSRKLFFHSYC